MPRSKRPAPANALICLLAGLLAVIAAPAAWAIEVGALRLIRDPGQALRAEIALSDRHPIIASELQARVPPRETFEAAGLRYHAALARLQIQPRQLPQGKAVLVLEGLPADAGTLDLLLTVGDRATLTVAEWRIELNSMASEFPAARAGRTLAAQSRPAVPARSWANAEVITPPASTGPDPRPQLEAAVQAWAKAWSRRDVKAYLAAYAPGFISADRSLSYESWAAQQRARIRSHRIIEVKITSLELDPRGEDWVASFEQSYRADQLRETSRRQLLLRQIGGRWLIVGERDDN